ncbi:MAG: hypothetical protein ABI904_10965 [Chloroflexota bacterium]
MKMKLVNILLIVVFLVAIWYRVVAFGDLRLSVANNDTASYINSSRAPIFSWQSFAGRRLFTTNLLYKLASDGENCKVTALSLPALGQEEPRQIQPCFDRIVLLQSFLSIMGWCILAWVTARRINNPFLKISSAAVILAFGFTPQIAEWDSLLTSESLSLSLFPIIFAVLQEIVFGIANGEEKQSNLINKILISLWMFVFLLWVFVRDVHLYAIIGTLVLSTPFLLINRIRKQTILLPITIILVACYMFGNYSAKQSTRWQPSLIHILEWYVFPHPTRVDFFIKAGMPDIQSGDQYLEWFNAHGVSTYGKFLVTHPGFVVATILERSEYFKSNFLQPYFRVNEVENSKITSIIGEMIHPETYAIYLIDLFFLISLCATAIKHRNKRALALGWLAAWMFFYAGTSLFVSYLGDLEGVGRHVYPSVEMSRLYMWVFLFPILDMMGNHQPELAYT